MSISDEREKSFVTLFWTFIVWASILVIFMVYKFG
jgi:hypothetical protein